LDNDTTVLFDQKIDFIEQNIQVITSQKSAGIHKRHKSRVGEIEYGICPRCKLFEIVEKHHTRLRRHRHPKGQRKERLQTCPDCHIEFHELADKLESMIREKYPLKSPNRFSIAELMREHVWEFDELNKRFFKLGQNVDEDGLKDIVAEGEKILDGYKKFIRVGR